ncbi:multidrug effflux MFS transporter [Janibacter endophyticus]|uniref:multidrug effflux MFS transporter n=1 Tax=Janibacter endophyticus TaxID=2806261 RepID=UPI0027DDFCC0|nr:multidrug effflux MFS transporter [Janibacter endophyticus]
MTTVLLALLGMFGPFSIDTPFPAFVQMREDFGVGSAQMQQVVSVYLISFAAMSLFHGPLSDAVGRKPVMVTGAAVYTLASIGAALAPSLPLLLICRALQGASAGAGTIVSRTVVRDLFEGPRAQRLMSAIAMIFGIGPAVAPIIGGWLLQLGPWPIVFWFLAIFGAFIAVSVLVLLPESHPPERRTPLRLDAILRNVVAAARDRWFLVLTGANAFSFAAQFLYIAGAPILVVDILGLGEQDFWQLFVPMVAAMVLGSFTNGRLAERVAGHRLITAGQGCSLTGATAAVLLAALPGTSGQMPWALVGLVMVAFGTGISMPVYQLALLDSFPNSRGTAASVSTFLMLSLNSLLAGFVAPVAGRTMLAFSATSLGLLLLGITLWAVHRRHVMRGSP